MAALETRMRTCITFLSTSFVVSKFILKGGPL
jgi:hypothetical protein